MERKEIQEARMRNYFIQATKEILKGEGIKSVSVRNIAERAGYSFATMYNYFRDVKDLIFLCVQDFQNEGRAFIEQEIKKTKRGPDRINAITWAYMKYFVQYPGIFELFYLEKFSDISAKQPTAGLITSFLDRLCEKEWEYCRAKKLVSMEESQIIALRINHLTTGMLLNYMNRRFPESYVDFEKTAKDFISDSWRNNTNQG